MKKNLQIISFDGLSKVDMEYLKNKPNFSSFLEKASYSFNVDSVYPSVTYPAHTSISTGCYPLNHGIVDNTYLQPNSKSPDWYWYAKDIQRPTFQEMATRKGYTVMTMLWPVNAGGKVKYNIPEIFANRPYKNQILVSLMNGSKLFQIEMFMKFKHLLKGISQPYLDEFVTKSYIYAMEQYKPDISMIHFTDLDSQRHRYGFSSKEAFEALDRHEERLGEILDQIDRVYGFENTDIILLGDHSSMDANHKIFLNSLFRNQGLITVENHRIKTWKAYGKTQGGSSYIYLSKENLGDRVRKILEVNFQKAEIERIYTREELIEMKVSSKAAFMLEAKKGYAFSDKLPERFLYSVDELKENNIKSKFNDHGYSPTLKKDYETVFMAKGPSIKEDIDIGKMCLVDEGPTFAKICGFELENIDGRILKEILK